MKTLRELRDKFQQLNERASGLISLATDEDRALTSEEANQYKDLTSQMDTLGAEIRRREQTEETAQPTRPQPAARSGRYHPTEQTRDDVNALFGRYIRQRPGQDDPYLGTEYAHASAEEQRASNDTDMNITTNADGGYLVPTGHYNGIIARRDESALDNRIGVMDIPGVGTTVNVPIDNEADGEFVSTNEAAGFDRDAPAIDQVAMTLVKYTKKIELSYELLQDETSRLLPFIENWVGRGMARTQNNLLVTEALASGTAAGALAGATAIADSEIPGTVYLLQEEYEDNAVWLMRRATQGVIYGKKGDNFQFVSTPQGSDAGSRNQLWQFPNYATQYMPAVGAGNKSLLFGNFSFMGRRLAPSIQFLRDPYTLAHLGQVRFLYYFRTVYKVLQAEAIIYRTHPTA